MTNREVFLLLFVLLVGLYTYTSVRSITPNSWIRWGYLVLVLCFSSLMAFFFLVGDFRVRSENNFGIVLLFCALLGWIFTILIWSVFILIDDARAIVFFVVRKGIGWVQEKTLFPQNDSVHISRWVFLQWLGMGLGGFFYGTLWWGMTNRHNYQVITKKVPIANLPNAWKGLKIVQISDIHCGSFTNREGVRKGVELANAQGADIILFTGDVVNNRAEEFEKWKGIFAKLQAPMGVYSVLGNHDYGNYISWPSESEKMANFEHLKALQRSIGWKLLLNEHEYLQRNGERGLILVGVENWSAKNIFPQYGKLSQAIKGADEKMPKILMSHDPSHWNAEIVNTHPSIKLTFSGHTHGMQFGFETPFMRWSPVQWIYKQWAGLYKTNDQFLYVNRGFGYIGYPGRVGILPEITVIELA